MCSIRFAALAAAFCVGFISSSPALASSGQIDDISSCEVFFTPGDSGFAAIREMVAKASKTIRVSAYHFKSEEVADMLIAAAGRGIDVAAVVDDKNFESKKHQIREAAEGGVRMFIDGTHHTHHNQYIVVDNEWVETGSFNYNDHAEFDNAENLIVVRSPKMAAQYLKNWEEHCAHASPYRPVAR